MDLNAFAEAISEYQSFVEKETALYNSRMIEAQQKLIASLGQNAKKPQSDVVEIYEDVVKVAREDYNKLKEYVNLIQKTHPEIPSI